MADLAALELRHGARYRWFLLAAVMLGTMASVMSSTIINVAIPEMSQQFNLGQERAQWVGSGFMLAMTVSMLTTPWLLERFGYRRTYTLTLWLLLLGGLAGGASNEFHAVLAARVAQGLAAGVMQPIPAIIILHFFAAREQGRATGLFGMGVVLASAMGPTVGGVLVHAFGWRSVFFMVLPFCLAALWMARRFVPVRPSGSGSGASASRLDWRGLLLGSVGVVCLLNALVQWRSGSAFAGTLLLASAALTLTGFVGWQRQLGRSSTHADVEPLVRLKLFHNRRFALGCVVAFLYGVALFGSTYLLPVYMQLALGLSPSYVGSILLPAGLVLAVTIALVGRLADRQPTYLLVSIGLALLALSFALMLTVHLGTAIGVLVAWAILGRLGLGFILPSLNLGALRKLHKHQISQGSSAINFVRMLGGSIGVSLCGIVLEWRLAAHGDALTHAASSPQRLAAFNEVFLMLATLCALALIAAWRLRDAPSARA